jgi:DNA-binding transcriptional ArsR family regulator
MIAAQVFKALGDPVRLKIIKRLSDGSDYTVGSLSHDLDMTRQGARKQIQILVSAKVVRLKPVGREIQVSLNTASLELARKFIANLENQWDQRLAALKDFVEK